MARTKKNYSLENSPKRAEVLTFPATESLVVVFGEQEYDFSKWLNHTSTKENAGRNDLIYSLKRAFDRMATFLSPFSLTNTFRSGLPNWIAYLDQRTESGLPKIIAISDITRVDLEDFASWLRYRPAKTKSGRLSYSGAKTLYGSMKSVLLECISSGVLAIDCIPDNPFPGSNRSMIGYTPYSKDEMQRLLNALGTDLQSIRSGNFHDIASDKLIIYYLLIAARTGRNPSPLLNISRDALQPHPLKPETHSLLTLYKRRGNNISIQSFRTSKEIEDTATISADVTTLFNEALALTEPYLEKASTKHQNSVWLFAREKQGGHGGTIGTFNSSNIFEFSHRFVKRHSLMSDEIDPATGTAVPFNLVTMRLRKTFATRMWKKTGGDLVRTANALGNQPRVTDTHYLAVTPEMIRNHHFLGKIFELELLDVPNNHPKMAVLAEEMAISVEDVKNIFSGKNNTGVSRCSSPLKGKFSPKDPLKPCAAFLNCFRCPNQVIMESDLHRMFSFYWLLVKERNLLGRNQWHKVYGWVIREIDQTISLRFPSQTIKRIRDDAYNSPHPMWRDRSMLGGL